MENSRLVVRETNVYGDSLFATELIPAGTIFLAEEPLLLVSSPSKELEAGIALEIGRKVSPNVSLYVAGVLAFNQADDRVQTRVLSDLYAPDLTDELKQSQMISDALLASKISCLLEPEINSETAKRVALILGTNGFSFESGSLALFQLGSKLAHSCGKVNSRYSSRPYFSAEGKQIVNGHHVALRDIQPGELISTSYLHGSFGNPERSQALFDRKGFWCNCGVCSGVDRMRGLPCPTCGPKRKAGGRLELIPTDLQTGFIFHDASKSANEAWKCDTCLGVFPDDPLISLGAAAWLSPDLERKLCSAVLAKDSEIEVSGEIELNETERLLESVDGFLGHRHWASNMALRMVVEGLSDRFSSAAAEDSVILDSAGEMLGRIEAGCWRLWEFAEQSGDEPTESCVRDFCEASSAVLAYASACRDQNFKERAAGLVSRLLDKIGPGIEATRGWTQSHIMLGTLDRVREDLARLSKLD